MKFESTKDLLNKLQNTVPENPYQLNDDGFKLVEGGMVEEGMAMLARSAELGVPWAAATYTWQKMVQGQPQDAIDFYYKVEEAITRETKANRANKAWREQFANVRSNVALAILATGGDEALALAWWEEGGKENHPESLFHPAIVAARNGNRLRALRIVESIPTAILTEMTKTLDDISNFSLQWFKDWAYDGQGLLREVLLEENSEVVSSSNVGSASAYDSKTPFENRCLILGQFWVTYKDDEDLSDFVNANDLGLPLAFFLAEGLVSVANPDAEKYINETWQHFSESLNLDSNKVYSSLEDLVPEGDFEE